MKKLVILLAVLAICLPAYASDVNAVDVLVYKVKVNLKGINLTTAEVGSVKAKGYLVMDANYSNDANVPGPVISDDVLILFGKVDGTMTIEGVNNVTYTLDVEKLNGKTGWGHDMGAASWDSVSVGKVKKAMDVGSGTDRVVVKSMKGHTIIWGGSPAPLIVDELIGSGKSSLKLVRKFTKDVNKAGLTLNDTRLAILADLPNKPKLD